MKRWWWSWAHVSGPLVRTRSGCLRRKKWAYPSRSVATHISVKDADALQQLPTKEDVSVSGWVRSVRKQKELVFMEVMDGSSPHHLQVVIPLQDFPHASEVTLGSSVVVQGEVGKSSHPGQRVEMRPSELRVVGGCSPTDYPFKARGRHSMEYLRHFPHLRPRTSSFSSILRVQQAAIMAAHEYLQSRDFLLVHTPILTSSDCEGGGEVFQAIPVQDASDPEKYQKFHKRNVFLTVSGQLHAEALASGLSRVYNFSPAFRAEKSLTRKHLSEFWMIEAEMVTVDRGLVQVMDTTEGLYRHTLEAVLAHCSEDVKFIHGNLAIPGTKGFVSKSLEQPFKRLTYTEAMEILSHAHKKKPFHSAPKWGERLHSEQEDFLVARNNQVPLFVTHFPAAAMPFYARPSDNNPEMVESMDLLAPVCGEVAGGSIREEREDVLRDKLEGLGMLDDYQWYLDLRRFGTMPHGGFGLGFERLLQAILGLEHVRDIIPFPRYLGSCDM